MEQVGLEQHCRLDAAVAIRPDRKFENNNPRLYNLLDLPQRPFEDDYPKGANTDEMGRLTTSIEGHELGGRCVVGRMARGPDETLPTPKRTYDTIAKEATGRATEVGPLEDWAETRIAADSGKPVGVYLSDRLKPEHVVDVYGHEIGHVVDFAAGQIPINGLHRELRQLYSFLNTGENRPVENLFGPEHRNYPHTDVDRELMAEAIRAYMENPNALKTLAPITARRIRRYVNEHPEIGRIIQFNSFGAAGALVLSSAGTGEDVKDE